MVFRLAPWHDQSSPKELLLLLSAWVTDSDDQIQ